MKTEPRILEHTSTLQGERVGMSIDEGALAHIMSVLTDLYSDPEMAVVREYATNAYDAHIEAGVSLPVEITLPTALSPFLKIRDFGSGLDVEDIRTIYSRYGASTKRETNDLVGTLGLGCKSALTYTNQFTLQGIKNGKCTQVSISRDEDGTGSMTIVAEFDTEDASGVEITIPAKARNSFAEKAKYLFQFWQDGTVLVNGNTPERLTGIEFASDLQIVSSDVLEDSVVVMGNVPYPVDALDGSYYRAIAYVPIGSVQFTPSREALQMTPKTTALIESLTTRINEGREEAVMRLVNEAKTKPEALAVALEAARLFSYSGELKYKGEVVPTSMDAPLLDGESEEARYPRRKPFLVVRANTWSGRRRPRRVSEETRLPISVALNHVFLTGFTNKAVSPTQRAKLEQWWDAHNQTERLESEQRIAAENFVCLDVLPHAEWVDPARVFDYASTVAVQKLARDKTRQDGKPAGAYKLAGTYNTMVQADEIDVTQPIYYCTYESSTRQSLLEKMHPKATFVLLSTNRVAKFQRLFPQAKEIGDAVRETVEAWFAGLSVNQLHWLTMDEHSRRQYAKLDAKLVDDPDLKHAISLAKQKNPKLAAIYRQYERLVSPKQSAEWKDPAKDYPLLQIGLQALCNYDAKLDALTTNHLYMYVNAAYRAAQASA